MSTSSDKEIQFNLDKHPERQEQPGPTHSSPTEATDQLSPQAPFLDDNLHFAGNSLPTEMNNTIKQIQPNQRSQFTLNDPTQRLAQDTASIGFQSRIPSSTPYLTTDANRQILHTSLHELGAVGGEGFDPHMSRDLNLSPIPPVT